VGEPLNNEDYEPGSWANALPEKYPTRCYAQRVRLAHFSVKEYLVSGRLQQSYDARLSRFAFRDTELHQSLSRNCCEYLLYFAREPQMQTWIDKIEAPESSPHEDCMEDLGRKLVSRS
jgi:hypothetical protein